MGNINERINKIVIDLFSDNNSKFAAFLGTSEANVRNYRRAIVPKIDIIAEISNKLNINYKWLIEGEGEMYIKPNIATEPTIELLKPQKGLEESIPSNIQEIPLYDLSATASVTELFSKNSNHIGIETIKIPNIPKCDGAIHVAGDSMYPLLKSGDIVLYKEGHDKDFILWGEMYLVYIVSDHGDEYFAVKYLQRSERPGYIKLVSYNDHHKPSEFPIDSLKKWALVKATIRVNSTI